MPRIIGSPRNELILNDTLAGCQVGLYYRMPTTSERQGYLNAVVKRERNKVTLHHAEARLKYGLKILEGVRDGDFLRTVNGRSVAMSSDPASPDFHPEWKKEIETGCGDLVLALAGLVFEGGAEVVTPEEDDDPGPAEDIAGE